LAGIFKFVTSDPGEDGVVDLRYQDAGKTLSNRMPTYLAEEIEMGLGLKHDACFTYAPNSASVCASSRASYRSPPALTASSPDNASRARNQSIALASYSGCVELTGTAAP
jgi:hypothetical protein